MLTKLNFVGYASGIAAGNSGCKDGPEAFQEASCLQDMMAQGIDVHWHAMIQPEGGLGDKYTVVNKLKQELADATYQINKNGEKFIVIGGDHSCGIGTWSGAHRALQEQGDLGLIWIDAHMDGHTPETSPTGNIHGMPVAALLGYGDKRLTTIAHPLPKLKPQHVCMIGIRSYEADEKELFEKLGVRVIYIEEVLLRGFHEVFAEAKAIAMNGTAGFGISIDLDGLDPVYAPGVGTPVAGGIHLAEVCQELKSLTESERCVGLEIAEFNPHECHEGLTAQAMCQMIDAWRVAM